jgi:hypothetical protein
MSRRQNGSEESSRRRRQPKSRRPHHRMSAEVEVPGSDSNQVMQAAQDKPRQAHRSNPRSRRRYPSRQHVERVYKAA